MNKKDLGFTLIELMIVLAVIGIIFSVGIPSYRNHVERSNRGEAISELQRIMSAQERFYADNFSYTTDLTDLGFNNATLTLDNYDIRAEQCANGAALTQCIQISADATGTQVGDGNLLLDSIGNQQRIVNGNIKHW